MAQLDTDKLDPQEKHLYDELVQACSEGDLTRLQDLLNEPAAAEVALARPVKQFNLVKKPLLNLWYLLQNVVRAGDTAIVKHLLAFAEEHDIPYPELINRDSAAAAIEGANSLEVFQAFVKAWPEAVKLDLSIFGDPLAYAVAKDQAELVKFLLESGADPNRRCGSHAKSGHHLRQSIRCSSLEITKALLQHGARAEHSGAIQEAARLGRLDVLELLHEFQADMNETLPADVGFLIRDKRHQQASETPLHTAVLHDQIDAARLLMAHGADMSLEDAQGRTPAFIAEQSRNLEWQALFLLDRPYPPLVVSALED